MQIENNDDNSRNLNAISILNDININTSNLGSDRIH